MSDDTNTDQPGLSDNPKLSARRSYRETPDVANAVCRLIRSIGKRVATEDPDGLQILREMEAEVERAWATAIAGLRSVGYTDTMIGDELGITKQAVQKRWPRDPEAALTAVS
jgi:hypothetical protein